VVSVGYSVFKKGRCINIRKIARGLRKAKITEKFYLQPDAAFGGEEAFKIVQPVRSEGRCGMTVKRRVLEGF